MADLLKESIFMNTAILTLKNLSTKQICHDFN